MGPDGVALDAVGLGFVDEVEAVVDLAAAPDYRRLYYTLETITAVIRPQFLKLSLPLKPHQASRNFANTTLAQQHLSGCGQSGCLAVPGLHFERLSC